MQGWETAASSEYFSGLRKWSWWTGTAKVPILCWQLLYMCFTSGTWLCLDATRTCYVVYSQLEKRVTRDDEQFQYISHPSYQNRHIAMLWNNVRSVWTILPDSALLILEEREDREDLVCSMTDSRAVELSPALFLQTASRRRALSKLWFSVKAKTIITFTPWISWAVRCWQLNHHPGHPGRAFKEEGLSQLQAHIRAWFKLDSCIALLLGAAVLTWYPVMPISCFLISIAAVFSARGMVAKNNLALTSSFKPFSLLKRFFCSPRNSKENARDKTRMVNCTKRIAALESSENSRKLQ